RKAVMEAGGPLEWGTPVLFSRSDDNRLIEMPAGDARPIIERQAWEPETILIEGGTFMMGSQPGEGIPEHETPQHEVYLPDYRIGRYPVTNREYGEFVRREKNTPDQPRDADWFNREPPADRLDHPVTGVSWHDAVRYCRWLSEVTGRRYRLPSEAEWEKAASWGREMQTGEQEDGQTKRQFPWPGGWDGQRCNVASNGTTPVSAHPDGASAYGVEDLMGNVQEWTRSLWQPYPYRPEGGREIVDGASLPTGAPMAHRGGSFKSKPDEVRCSARGNYVPESRPTWRGFRVAVEVKQDG
ncbi:MAG: SUMF1/EgtB/PvdO family nonheme iron enzyme, partial [Caldilinea sp.]|nr:SUMF1/EgtB/PvdO family nonheme iron enzyme [Caldilinea sp.]